MAAFIDRTGQRFGRLVAVSYANGKWFCRCDCGGTKEVIFGRLRSGNTRSCGCLHKETTAARSFRHGGNGTRLYQAWQDMRKRCGNPKSHAFHRYGGRGISVCDEWESFVAFSAWANASGYSDDLEIDRIDNDAGYFPENCRWVTTAENCRNRCNTRRITAFGREWTLPDAAAAYGMTRDALYLRLYRYGMAPETALTKPFAKRRLP